MGINAQLYSSVLHDMKTALLYYLLFQAQSVENDGTCGNMLMSSQVGARDAITRQLLVEVCLADDNNCHKPHLNRLK